LSWFLLASVSSYVRIRELVFYPDAVVLILGSIQPGVRRSRFRGSTKVICNMTKRMVTTQQAHHGLPLK